MAVDSKQGSSDGTAANGQNGHAPPTRPSAKRISSLMKQGSALPTVENSLEEFIAKANQTLVDVTSWEQSARQAKEDDEKRREQDQQRWQAAETQLREGEQREVGLRRQLDGLQGKLAEAEARAAIAMSSAQSGNMAAQQTTVQQEAAIRDLRAQIEEATVRMRASEARSAELAAALGAAKADATAMPAVALEPDDRNVEERIRLAEAKATKALAAARAAAAGLTVSSADLAAIESGLVAAKPIKKSPPWLAIGAAFLGGLAIMGVVWKVVLDKPAAPTATQAIQQPAPAVSAPTPTPAPAAASAQAPAAAPQVQAPASAAPAAPAKPQPTVTPIEENTAGAPAAAPGKPGPTVTPIEDTEAPSVDATGEANKSKSVAKRPTPRPAAASKKATTLADPFSDPAKKSEKKPAEKKPALVDPF